MLLNGKLTGLSGLYLPERHPELDGQPPFKAQPR